MTDEEIIAEYTVRMLTHHAPITRERWAQTPGYVCLFCATRNLPEYERSENKVVVLDLYNTHAKAVFTHGIVRARRAEYTDHRDVEKLFADIVAYSETYLVPILVYP